MSEPTAEPTPTEPAKDPVAAAEEEKFWKELESRVDGRLNTFFEKKKEELFPTKSNRNGNRETLPEMIANLMFGAKK